MDATNDGMTGVYTRVNLVAEHTLLAFAAPASIAIRRWFGWRIRRPLARLAGRIGSCRDQRGVDQRALLEDQLLGLQLPIDLGENLLDQPILREFLSKPPQRTVIGGLIVQAQTNKATERQSIRDGGFQRGIRQIVPYPGKQAAKQDFRRITAVASAIAAPLAEQGPERHPIHNSFNLIQDAAPRRPNQAVRQAHLPDIAFNHGSPRQNQPWFRESFLNPLCKALLVGEGGAQSAPDEGSASVGRTVNWIC